MTGAMTYAQLAGALADQTKASGGTKEQRIATVLLWCAVLRHRVVDMVRELRRADVDATLLGEGINYVLRISGEKRLTVTTLPEELRLGLNGFDDLVPKEYTTIKVTPGSMTFDEVVANVDRFLTDFSELLRRSRGT